MLSFGNNTGGSTSGNSIKVGEGVYCQKGTIKKARCEKNAKMFEAGMYMDDIAIRMMLDIGMDWEKEVYVGGNFKKSPTPQGGESVIGWGSAFKVERIFSEFNIEGQLTEDFLIEESCVNQLIGRELFYLDYASRVKDNGKVGYNTYSIVAAARDGESDQEVAERLYDQFTREVEKGYLKNYRPEILQQDDSWNFAGGGDGAASGEASGQASVSGTTEAPW